jgi:hypothetical protein
LDYDELQELYDWIDYRIYRHEQPKGYEVENEVGRFYVLKNISVVSIRP